MRTRRVEGKLFQGKRASLVGGEYRALIAIELLAPYSTKSSCNAHAEPQQQTSIVRKPTCASARAQAFCTHVVLSSSTHTHTSLDIP